MPLDDEREGTFDYTNHSRNTQALSPAPALTITPMYTY